MCSMRSIALIASSVVFLAPTYLNAQELPQVAEGLPEHLIYIYTNSANRSSPDALQQLFDGRKRWESNRILRVCLFGGNKVVAKLVRDVASEWNSYSSVKLDFGSNQEWNNCLSPQLGFFQIRIGFSERGYWSVVGNDSEGRLDPLTPSMNLESFNRIYSESRFSLSDVTTQAQPYHKTVIRHEFGHALGLLHEHQNPSLKCTEEIKWTGPNNVYEYFSKSPNNWTPLQVDRNLGFIGQTDPGYVAGDADRKSVMMYSLPKEIFKGEASNDCYVPVNYDISAKDKQIISKIYASTPVRQPQQDIDIKTSTVKPSPKFISEANSEDLISRIIVDLESSDTYIRRDARARLADLLDNGISQPKISDLVQRMSGASYRYQLGVAVALANSSKKPKLDEATKLRLTALAGTSSDATLKRNLQSAVK